MWFGSEVFDNIHNVDFDQPSLNWQNDDWEIMMDADHSGGQYAGFGDPYTADQVKDLTGRNAQQWILTYPPPPGMPVFWAYSTFTWLNDTDPNRLPELMDWGCSYEGDPKGEGTTRYEWKMAVWDELDWRGPDQSRRHILKADDIIGIQSSFGDFDQSSTDYTGFWTLSNQAETFKNAERFTDAQMIKGTTAVEANTWGRIKAGFAR
jgi:hypothetical protein